ncbi:MAG: hypothetical protein ACAI35_24990 [Candidatus Methylacidiphilales bacterium]|nr:hypothetical protein [Candidatus Methylacidiphilales bacterium]
MAFSKKGKRRIVVFGNAYLWCLHKIDYDSDPITIMFTIYRDGEPHPNDQRLHSRLLWNPSISITPSKVRMVIEHALKNGWDAAIPDMPGAEVYRGYEQWKEANRAELSA